jgi:putative ABC transport system substrate-binding protein
MLAGSRRQFFRVGLSLAGLGVLAGCGRMANLGQPVQVPRIGYLGAGLSGPYPALLGGLRQGLRDLGYLEGENILVEYRFTDGGLEKAPAFVAELIGLKVDLLVTTGAEATAVAKKATTTVPIVATILGGDPVGEGLVVSLARPGGNVTGLTAGSGGGLVAKRLQILKEVVPGASRVAILWNANNPTKTADVKEAADAAPSLGMQMISIEVRRADDLDGAFQAIAAARVDALMVFQDPLAAIHSTRIVAFAAEHRLPAIYEVRLWTEVGGLMNYGINSVEQFHRAATYVDKILKGASPADLPIEQPTKLEFVVNTKAARALGLTFPPSVLIQATEVVQ